MAPARSSASCILPSSLVPVRMKHTLRSSTKDQDRVILQAVVLHLLSPALNRIDVVGPDPASSVSRLVRGARILRSTVFKM